MWVCLALSIAALYWVYDGYGRCLSLLVAIRTIARRGADAATLSAESSRPTLTVLLTVHNEETVVEQRIRNLLACDYPADRMQVFVASDGSTDATNSIAGRLAAEDGRVVLFETEGLGKSETQNRALEYIRSEIVVFTDADIRFDQNCLTEIVRPFSDPHVGAVDAHLLYGSGGTGSSASVGSQGYYWNYELKLRTLESQLGCLAVVAGASFAVRRALLRVLPSSVGEDCIVPLDVVSQSHRVVHSTTALAFDDFEDSNSVTLRRRIRMTLRNWQGTWMKPQLLNPLRHPGYAFALWSHKLLRWLSPCFLLTGLASSIVLLAGRQSLLSSIPLLLFTGLFVMAGIGWLAERRHVRIPGAATAFSFVLANTAFLIGVARAIAGRRVHSYRNV